MPILVPLRVAGVAGYRTFLVVAGLCLALLALHVLLAAPGAGA